MREDFFLFGLMLRILCRKQAVISHKMPILMPEANPAMMKNSPACAKISFRSVKSRVFNEGIKQKTRTKCRILKTAPERSNGNRAKNDAGIFEQSTIVSLFAKLRRLKRNRSEHRAQSFVAKFCAPPRRQAPELFRNCAAPPFGAARKRHINLRMRRPGRQPFFFRITRRST